MYYIAVLLGQFIAVAFVLTLHEFAHAFVAYKCGDPTPKFAGRLTLNPVKHFDLLGTLLFALVGFGWAKPVPINPNNFKSYKKGCFWTSIAGVLCNYITAFLFFPLYLLMAIHVLPLVSGTYMYPFLYTLFYGGFLYSLSFCIFNLIPVYPLDGFRVLEASNLKKGKVYWFLRQNGQFILYGLIFIHFLSSRIAVFGVIDILGYILDFASKIFGKPIILFWYWIFGI